MFMVETASTYKWYSYTDDDSTEFDDHNDTYDIVVDKDDVVGIEVKRNHVIMVTDYYGLSVKFKLSSDEWESFQRDLKPTKPKTPIVKKTTRTIDYQIARDGDNEDALDYFEKLWRWCNKTKFGGALKLPTIRLLRSVKAHSFRTRAHWRGSSRTMSFSKRLLHVSEEYVTNVMLHEMCHQAVSEIDKLTYREENNGHGPFWRGWMKKIGMAPDQYDKTSNTECMDPEEKQKHDEIQQRVTEASKLYAPYRSPPGVLQPVAIFLPKTNEFVFGVTVCPTSNNLKAKKWVVVFKAGSNYYYDVDFRLIRKVDSAKAAEIWGQDWKHTIYNVAIAYFRKQQMRSGKDILSFTPMWYPSIKRWLEDHGMRF